MKKLKSFTYTNMSSNWSATINSNDVQLDTITSTNIWEDAHKGHLKAKDIVLDGKSLSETLEKIEDRLAILHHNQELEDRWDELKNLANQYRELEQELLEKEKSWNIIKNG
jgi:hypothetical protein